MKTLTGLLVTFIGGVTIGAHPAIGLALALIGLYIILHRG
jgi:hypothetical protein